MFDDAEFLKKIRRHNSLKSDSSNQQSIKKVTN